MKTPDFDRPSMHGKFLGEALVLMAKAGWREGARQTKQIPERCLTCAFRPGTVANMSAGTGLKAFNCATGVDPSTFGCHHGMVDGSPARDCAGYFAALLAPFPEKKEIIAAMMAQLEAFGIGEEGYVDAVRADFDAWYATLAPEVQNDVYRLSRAYEARKP